MGWGGVFSGEVKQVYLLICVYLADEATLALMKTPRCSLPDLPPGAQARRKRQTPPPTKWSKRNLSWRFVARVGAPQDSVSLSFCHPWGQTSSERIPPGCRLWIEGGVSTEIWPAHVITPHPPHPHPRKAGICTLPLNSSAFSSWGLEKRQTIREHSCQGGGQHVTPEGGPGRPQGQLASTLTLGSGRSHGTHPWAGILCVHSCTTPSKSGVTSHP